MAEHQYRNYEYINGDGTIDSHHQNDSIGHTLQFVKPNDTPMTHTSHLNSGGVNMYHLGTATTTESPEIARQHQQQQHPEQDPRQATASFTITIPQNRAVSPTESSTNEALDRKFYTMMLEIDKRYQNDSKLQKHEKIRIEQWSRKLCQVTKNTSWKRNRNLYATWLLDMILNKKLGKPFTKVPPDSNNLDMLQATEVKAQLSKKVKNVLNRRDKSEERKAVRENTNVSEQSQRQFTGVEVDLRNSSVTNNYMERSRSGSRGRERKRTATFAKVDFHQQSHDNIEQQNKGDRGLLRQQQTRNSVKTEKMNSSLHNSNPPKHTRFQDDHEQFSVELLPSVGQNGSFYQNLIGGGPGLMGHPHTTESAMNQAGYGAGSQAYGGDHHTGGVRDFYAPVHEDTSVEARAKIQDLQAQLVKMKADKDVLEITVKHLKTELNSKSTLGRRQTDELSTLRDSVLELQRQNTHLRSQNLAQKKATNDQNQTTPLLMNSSACEVSFIGGGNISALGPPNPNNSTIMVSPQRQPVAMTTSPIVSGQYIMQQQQQQPPHDTIQTSQPQYSRRRNNFSPANMNSSAAAMRPQQQLVQQQRPPSQSLIMVQSPQMVTTSSANKARLQSEMDLALQQLGMDIDRVFM